MLNESYSYVTMVEKTKEEHNMFDISIKQLLEAGVHFGHPTKKWNPKMAEFLLL